jgi:hypothetical protein
MEILLIKKVVFIKLIIDNLIRTNYIKAKQFKLFHVEQRKES